jgi:hypothetical protein
MINGSQELRGPNMRVLYQGVRPVQYGKCLLDSSLTMIFDPPTCQDQRQG